MKLFLRYSYFKKFLIAIVSGETFCHTLHIMDSKGASVLVNKKCTSEKECQRTKVGCVQIDAQMVIYNSFFF